MTEIMCVVVVKSGVLEAVHTFIKEDGETYAVKAAERLFEEIINGMDDDVSEEEMESCKDEGHYESRNGYNDVWLCSSTPEDVVTPTPEREIAVSLNGASVSEDVNCKYCFHCKTAITDVDDITMFCQECGAHLAFAVISDNLPIWTSCYVRNQETIKSIRGSR